MNDGCTDSPEDYINKKLTICSPLRPPSHSVRATVFIYHSAVVRASTKTRSSGFHLYFHVRSLIGNDEAALHAGVSWAKYEAASFAQISKCFWDLSKGLGMLISSVARLRNVGGV